MAKSTKYSYWSRCSNISIIGDLHEITRYLPVVMEKFTLINKDRSRIKVFELFEDVSKPSPSIDAMMVSYGCVYKRSSKPVMKGSRVETVEAAREEYKKLLEEGWKKNSIFNSYF